MGKPSRREREAADKTRRLLLVGGAAAGVTAVASAYIMTRPPVVPTLSGAEPISTRLSRIGPTPHHQQLTGTGADLLVISDTGCAYCREFVRTGLEPLIRFAGENGLSAAYLSVGYGRSGLISTIASACAQREGSRLTGPDLVRALFALTEAGVPDGIDPEGAIVPAASALGVTRAELTRCVPEEALQFRDRFEATRSLFELARTPTFFLSDPDDPSRVMKLEGFASAGALTRRLERALRAG
jgi:hypothetical protein